MRHTGSALVAGVYSDDLVYSPHLRRKWPFVCVLIVASRNHKNISESIHMSIKNVKAYLSLRLKKIMGEENTSKDGNLLYVLFPRITQCSFISLWALNNILSLKFARQNCLFEVFIESTFLRLFQKY